MRCKSWLVLCLAIVASAMPAGAQPGEPDGLSRLLSGPHRPAEPAPLRAAAAELAELRALPHALVAVGDLQAAEALLTQARALLAYPEAGGEQQRATETAWAHLAVAGRRLALHYTQLEIRRLRDALAADGEAPAASASTAAPTAQESRSLAPDYAARADRARRRVAEADEGMQRGHAQELLQLWEQAAALEARRIRGERQRAGLSQERVRRRRAWLAERVTAEQAHARAERAVLAEAQRRKTAAAYRRLAQGSRGGVLQQPGREDMEHMLGLSELWIEAASHMAAIPASRLQAARDLVLQGRSTLQRPRVSAKVALRACERAVQAAERLLGQAGLEGEAALIEQAALRGLDARPDATGGAWVSLPGARMEAPSWAVELSYAAGGLHRMFPHLSVSAANRPALRRALGRLLPQTEWVALDGAVPQVRFTGAAVQP